MDTFTTLELTAEARAAGPTGRGKRIREAARLSTIEVAAGIGVTHAAVSQWEAGKRRPRGKHAIRYAQLLRHLDKTNGRPASTPDAREESANGGRHDES